MSLQQKCLPVPKGRKRPNPESNISTETEPMEITCLESMDAMEYLAFVKQQASSLPDVFVSQEAIESSKQSSQHTDYVPIDGSAAARDYILSHRLDIIPPPTNLHIPCNDTFQTWKDETLDTFSTLRTYLNACRQGLRSIHPSQKFTVPKSKDVYAWHVFCLGNGIRNEMEHKMIDVHLSNLNKDASVAEIDLELKQYDIPKDGYEPSTQLLCQFDQIIIRKLLSHHLQFLTCGCSASVKRLKWIYAVLSRLEKPIHRDEASVLMALLREMCRVRASIDFACNDGDNGEDDNKLLEKKEIVKAANVLILLIGAYFEQCTVMERLFNVDKRK